MGWFSLLDFSGVYQSSLRRILLLFLKDDIHRVASSLQLEETFKSFVCTFFFFFFFLSDFGCRV